ncbi:MAG TPA: hypothetical protein VI036_10835 [Propionibacteriaceae bacterium]
MKALTLAWDRTPFPFGHQRRRPAPAFAAAGRCLTKRSLRGPLHAECRLAAYSVESAGSLVRMRHLAISAAMALSRVRQRRFDE